MSSAKIASRNGSPATRERWPDRLPLAAGPGTSAKAGWTGKLSEFIGRERIDRRLELEPLLAIGLQPKSGRTLSAVAEAHRERVARAQVAAADADEQRVRKGRMLRRSNQTSSLAPLLASTVV